MSSSSSSTSIPLDIFIRIPLLPDAIHIEDTNNELLTVSAIQQRLLSLVAAAQDGEGGHHPRRSWGSCRLIRGGKELRGPTLVSTLGLTKGEHLHGLLIEGPPASLPSATTNRPVIPTTEAIVDGVPLTSRERLIAIRRLQMDARLAASRREEADGMRDDLSGVNPLDAVAAFHRLWPQDDAGARAGTVNAGGEMDESDVVDGRFGVNVAGSDIQRRRRRPGTMPAPRTVTPNPPAATPPANSIDVQEIIQRAMREPRWRLAAGCIVGFILHVVAVPLIFFGFIVSTSTDVKGYTAQYWRGTNNSITSSNILRYHIQTVSERLADQRLNSQKEAGDVSVVEMEPSAQPVTRENGDDVTGDEGLPNTNAAYYQLTQQNYEGDWSLFKQLNLDTPSPRDGGAESDCTTPNDLLLRVPPSFFAPHRGSTYSTVLETNTDDFWMRSGHETGSMLFFCGIVMGAVVNVGFAIFATFSADTLIVASPQ